LLCFSQMTCINSCFLCSRCNVPSSIPVTCRTEFLKVKTKLQHKPEFKMKMYQDQPPIKLVAQVQIFQQGQQGLCEKREGQFWSSFSCHNHIAFSAWLLSPYWFSYVVDLSVGNKRDMLNQTHVAFIKRLGPIWFSKLFI
jgi:hypothetical protein